jgi:hypothetical protein
MSSWEYKLISSGPLGFASMPLLEQHLGQLGKDEWEIINFTTKPDNPLVFHGLARRPVARDWFPPAETKPAYTPPPIPKEAEDDERDERSFADELPPARPANAPAPADLGLGDFDDLAGSEDDLPTLFEALQPFLRKNPRGDLSVDLDFLAKKFEQDGQELLAAFEECGLKAPVPPGEKGEVVDHDGSLYWLERDKRGRIWVNTRDKKFKLAKGTPVPAEAAGGSDAAPARESRAEERAGERAPADRPESRPPRGAEPRPAAGAPDNRTFLGRIRAMMRRNHRGHGWSGSFPYLTKALKLDEAGLLAELNLHGLKLPEEGEAKPPLAPDGEFVYWLNKNQRGEIWINAELAREREAAADPGWRPKAEPPAAVAGPAPVAAEAPAAPLPPRIPPPENTLTAVRLLLQPKKRGEGVTALVTDLARQLEKPEEQLRAALALAGLIVPESPKAKPTFAEHGGEIFWLNVNPKGQVWLNAKAAAAKKSRAKKSAD